MFMAFSADLLLIVKENQRPFTPGRMTFGWFY
jgi:hypothetical protein